MPAVFGVGSLTENIKPSYRLPIVEYMQREPAQPVMIDLFAGLGGFRVGLERVGFKTVYGADFNPHAAEIYETNFGDKIFQDVSKIVPETLPDFNVLCGGFPCQPFSKAGKGLGFEDTRGTLFFDVARIIERKQPQVVFLENVKNLYTHDKGNTYETIQNTLKRLGYDVSSQILNANDYGLPQNRQRIIIVASKTVPFDFTQIPTTPHRSLTSVLETTIPHEWVNEAEYTLIPPNERKTQKTTGLKFVGYFNRQLRAGTNPNQINFSRVHRQPNRIYDATGTHPTLSSTETSGRYYIYTVKPDGTYGVRKLTLNEAYRLFGYPDTYKKVGSKTNQYARLGNSIAVPMVESVGKEILNQLFPYQ